MAHFDQRLNYLLRRIDVSPAADFVIIFLKDGSVVPNNIRKTWDIIFDEH